MSPQVQPFGPIFIRWDWVNEDKIYKESCSVTGDFGAHLYWSRFDPWPVKYNYEWIKYSNSTFGELARYVFFRQACICPGGSYAATDVYKREPLIPVESDSNLPADPPK